MKGEKIQQYIIIIAQGCILFFNILVAQFLHIYEKTMKCIIDRYYNLG